MEKQPDKAAGDGKNKGGRPKTKTRYFNRKVTLYLTDEEYGQLETFLDLGWIDQNYSSAARFLLLHSLEKWAKKGKKPVGLKADF